jgi:hypothetical protein
MNEDKQITEIIASKAFRVFLGLAIISNHSICFTILQ